MSFNDEQVAKDKQRLKAKVASSIIDSLPGLCQTEQENGEPNGIFTQISNALNDGSHNNKAKLVVEILTGGYTNFSYRIRLERDPETSSENEIKLFAKLCFERALWNPDKSKIYLLDRTANEYSTMKSISDNIVTDNSASHMIAKPHLCLDLLDGDLKMKLLVTSWCEAGDEQWANQLIDGIVDERIPPQLGRFLAQVHSMTEFPKDMNEDVRETLIGSTASDLAKVEELLAMNIDDNNNTRDQRIGKLLQSWGGEVCRSLWLLNQEDLRRKECFCHQDIHAFNILAESKPPVSTLQQFGPEGTVAVVDWEMAFWGPRGKDIGMLWSVPIISLLAHAFNGHAYSVDDGILSAMDNAWDSYSKEMLENKVVDEACLQRAYRNSMAWCGWFMFFAHYNIGAMVEHLPGYDELSPKDQYTLREAIGMVAVKFLHFGYVNEDGQDKDLLPIEELKKIRNDILSREVEYLDEIAATRRKQTMRMSMLRTTGRRVSDAPLNASIVKDVNFRNSLLFQVFGDN
mmetsp:Transcript_10588/g.23509  ORF Transcript_10588/g.23509 Transcript_10588/m.23509 type:complete len:516 (-) Transcript_10588:81-1628(-)